MGNPFFERPILNSPYLYPARHWELDLDGQPTQRIVDSRRSVSLITPIPKPRKRKRGAEQATLVLDEGAGISTERQQYDPTPVINELRHRVDQWRSFANPNTWGVTPETARLLQYWRHHDFGHIRPFFCQVEAVETAIWLTEVAPTDREGKRFLEHLANANADANPDLNRLALKLATGAGKTTVMAMLIAWQTINAVRHPQSKRFTRGFLVVTPGLTIKDRLRVLEPNDPDSYYTNLELVPEDMLDEVRRAKIVITNYHAFKRREQVELSKGGRQLLQGRTGGELDTLETEGQMIRRVMPDLMGLKNILVLNDEAHHCYREKPRDEDDDSEADLKGDDRKEAEKNNEAARLWISGLEIVNRTLGVNRVIDLSATPFFLRGSGFAEGTLFPWTMSDFSLMDAIECGIVKLPRVPVAENITGDEMPMFRNLWENIRKDMPKKGRGKSQGLDPLALPTRLQTALQALYGHYEKTFALWQERGIAVPPCFIIVCNNTSTSKLVYDFISGFHRQNPDGSTQLENGRLALFRNFDENGNPLRRLSYELREEEPDKGLFNVEYADVLGIPFDFTAKPVVAPPQPPRPTVQVKAVRPDRDALEIRFPRVAGYRVELPEERLTANFTDDSTLELTPDLVGPSVTRNQGIIGEGVDLTLEHLDSMRPSTVLFHVTQHLLYTKWRDAGDAPKLHLFGQLKRITKQWLDHHLICTGGTKPALLMYKDLADRACNRITAAITAAHADQHTVKAILDAYNPEGSTAHVRFNTSRPDLWTTSPDRCHVNLVVLDSDWEAEFCRVAESHPRVKAYVKNHNLGLEVPYRAGSETRRYLPDFIALVDDGRGPEDLLHLIVEIKGYRREDAKEKKSTMDAYWVPGVNNLGAFGRWAFAEFREIYRIESDFEAKVAAAFDAVIRDGSAPANAAVVASLE